MQRKCAFGLLSGPEDCRTLYTIRYSVAQVVVLMVVLMVVLVVVVGGGGEGGNVLEELWGLVSD